MIESSFIIEDTSTSKGSLPAVPRCWIVVEDLYPLGFGAQVKLFSPCIKNGSSSSVRYFLLDSGGVKKQDKEKESPVIQAPAHGPK